MKKLLISLLRTFSLSPQNAHNHPGVWETLPAEQLAGLTASAFGPVVVNNQYDAQGRLVATFKSDGSKTEYDYLPGCVVLNMFNSRGEFLYHYTYELNEDRSFRRVTKSDLPDYEELHQYNHDKTIARRIVHFKGIKQELNYSYYN